jgi:hypothetical protein
MDRKMMFHDVSPAELRSVEGGLSWSGIWDGIKSAASWVGDHVWGALTDMAGAAGWILGLKGTF